MHYILNFIKIIFLAISKNRKNALFFLKAQK
jgi:hypothetical protein